MNKILITTYLLLSTTFNILIAQETEADTNALREKKIVFELQKFNYDFFKKDTLIYKAVVFDSLLINYGRPIVKTRLEHIELTCDSVTKDRKFLISQRLLNFISDEKYSGEVPERRETSPWINRRVRIWIDSMGNRLQVIPDDTLKYAISPGGAFMPTIIFPFKNNYIYINESWNVNSTDTLIENGIPPAIVKQSSLFRAARPIDTLGYECTRFSFIKTALGNINIFTPEQVISTESTITGSGIVTISKEYWIPIHIFQNSEQKLSIFNSENDELPGQHYTSVDWTLDKFVPSPDRFPKQQNKGKKKKK